MTQAYPLQWPAGVARTVAHKRADPQFVASIGGATKDLLDEVRRMSGTLPVISTNLELRNDGLPYANQKQPSDPGVALYFQRRGKPLVFACDRWRKIEHNMRAIAKTIDALRGIERWGSAEMVDQAFTGFTALPSSKAATWRAVLDLPDGPVTGEMIDAAYRLRAVRAHPDKGGSTEAMAALNRARADAKASLSPPTAGDA